MMVRDGGGYVRVGCENGFPITWNIDIILLLYLPIGKNKCLCVVKDLLIDTILKEADIYHLYGFILFPSNMNQKSSVFENKDED